MRQSWPAKSRRWLRTFLSVGLTLLYLVIIGPALLTLSAMRISPQDFGTQGLIVLGLMFGFTSLFYSRASAFPDNPIRRRSLVIAELALRSTVWFLVGFLLLELVLFWLVEFGYEPQPSKGWPKVSIPTFLVYTPIIISIVGFSLFTQALAMYLVKTFSVLRAREVVSRDLRNRKR